MDFQPQHNLHMDEDTPPLEFTPSQNSYHRNSTFMASDIIQWQASQTSCAALNTLLKEASTPEPVLMRVYHVTCHCEFHTNSYALFLQCPEIYNNHWRGDLHRTYHCRPDRRNRQQGQLRRHPVVRNPGRVFDLVTIPNYKPAPL